MYPSYTVSEKMINVQSNYETLQRLVLKYGLYGECTGSYLHAGIVSFSEVYFFGDTINKLDMFVRKHSIHSGIFIPQYELEQLIKEVQYFKEKMEEKIKRHNIMLLKRISAGNRQITSVSFKFLEYEGEVLLYHNKYKHPCIKTSIVPQHLGTPKDATLSYHRSTGRYSLHLSAAGKDVTGDAKHSLLVNAIFKLMFA